MHIWQRRNPVLLEGPDCRPVIPLDKGMLVYNAMVFPVMPYSCSSWSVTSTLLHKLDACHMRSIFGMRCPKWIISNEDLYVRSATGSPSQQVRRMRRSMFGPVLRMPEDTLRTTVPAVCGCRVKSIQGASW